jgi:hypothetical protein
MAHLHCIIISELILIQYYVHVQSPPNLLPRPRPPHDPENALVQPELLGSGIGLPALKLDPYALWLNELLSAPNALFIIDGVCIQFLPP